MKKKPNMHKPKSKFMVISVSLLIILFILYISRPSEEKYASWLYEEYGIKCNKPHQCYDYHNNKNIKLRTQGITDGYLLFALYNSTFNDEQDQEILNVKALGLLNTFFEIK
jgi:hypothetical protein